MSRQGIYGLVVIGAILLGTSATVVFSQISTQKSVPKTSDDWWEVLTSPTTSHATRMATAKQARDKFQLKQLPKLLDSLDLLRSEEQLHHWGFEIGNMQSVASLNEPRMLTAKDRHRMILGHEWIVPDKEGPSPYSHPSKFNAGKAPWPWSVKEALSELYYELVPTTGVSSPPSDIDYAEKWYDETFKFPCGSDKEALRFVEVTLSPAHYKTLPVLARWRKIALNPKMPEAAARVAANIGEAMHLWDDPRAQEIGQAMLAEIILNAKSQEVRHQAAWSCHQLKDQLHVSQKPGDPSTVKLPTPWIAIVALGDAATNPKYGDSWSRLYCFGSPACFLLAAPPVKKDINGMVPNSQEAINALKAFTNWFKKNRAAMLEKGKLQAMAARDIEVIRNGS